MRTLRLTEQQYKAMAERNRACVAQHLASRRPEPKKRMNKTEALYAAELEMQKRVGMIDWCCFECMKLRLADGAFFKPDFPVIANGVLEFREVKGFMREAANVRIKVAAELYPFTFRVIKYDRGAWTSRDV